MAVAGYTGVFSYQCVQVIGTTEWSFLESVGAAKRQEIFSGLYEYRSPVWILAHSFPVHKELADMCLAQNVPILLTSLSTGEFITRAQRILDDWFAPYCTVHGTLVDVYGVGMLYIGRSGVGKSECALDLVERGHRLVADDVVHIVRNGNSIIGKGNQSLGHHMEIRGVGIVDIGRLFGIRAIRDQKKVELIVELQDWQEGETYERTGLEELNTNVMEINIPKKIIPISPGKNITVISEVMAMNMLLKMNGIDVARLFNDNLIEMIKRKSQAKHARLAITDPHE